MRTVSINGFKLAVHQAGAGTPLLLVHGFPLSHAMWREQISVLGDEFLVITPDLRGFGQSDVTAGVVTMEQFADDLNDLLDALEITTPVVLCGLSMGGYVAWQFARKYGSRLRGLVLCDTRAVPDTAEGAANRQRLAQLVLDKGAEAAASAMLPNLFSAKTQSSRQHLIDEMRQIIVSTAPEGIAAALLGMAQRPDARPLLPQINVPSLLIVGVEDKISTVAEMREMSGSMPNAALVEIPEAGHMAPLEHPEPVNEAIRNFVRKLR